MTCPTVPTRPEPTPEEEVIKLLDDALERMAATIADFGPTPAVDNPNPAVEREKGEEQVDPWTQHDPWQLNHSVGPCQSMVGVIGIPSEPPKSPPLTPPTPPTSPPTAPYLAAFGQAYPILEDLVAFDTKYPIIQDPLDPDDHLEFLECQEDDPEEIVPELCPNGPEVESEVISRNERPEPDAVDIYVVGDAAPQRGSRLRKLEQGILVDSGAGATLANGAVEFPEFKLAESEGSARGQTFQGPGGGKKDVMKNLGQRQARLRLGQPHGQRGELTFQEVEVRRPILSVGESTEAGNSLWFDDVESVIFPKGSEEQKKIRAIVKAAVKKLTMKKDRKVFKLDAWVELPDEEEGDFFKR